MNDSPTTGHVGYLTHEEEGWLQQTWIHLLRLCDNQYFEKSTDNRSNDDNENAAQKKGLGSEVSQTTPDKTTELLQHLQDRSPENFWRHLWEFIKFDHPDALVLRFLRARKWDPEKAAAMLVSAVNWRVEMCIEDEIVRQGEAVGLTASPSKEEVEFMEQYRSGKSYVRGTDIENHPIYTVKNKLHNPTQQSDRTMEKYVLHNIESLRVIAREPDDKICLIFDLTGFGLRNMDFHLVKFILEVFEARYPETLSSVLVHNAPFVFWGIWNIVKGWLDPVIADKVHFTRKATDLEEFIPREKLEISVGGADPWEYKYFEPVAGENDKMMDSEKKIEIQQERDMLATEFDRRTVQWILSNPKSPEAEEATSKRHELARKLHDNYWRIDPYIRTRNYYDRIGAISSQGRVNYDVISG